MPNSDHTEQAEHSKTIHFSLLTIYFGWLLSTTVETPAQRTYEDIVVPEDDVGGNHHALFR